MKSGIELVTFLGVFILNTKNRPMKNVFSFILCLSFAFVGCSQEPKVVAGQDSQSQTEIIDSTPQKKLTELIIENHIPKSELSILIDKSAYTLSVLHKDSVLISYPCVLGFNAIDDKHQEGDGCTPEGTFGVRSMYAHKSWKYFIWIDYPNSESWDRFNTRKADGTIEQSATIGGEIGIHGVPDGADYLIDDNVNWTLGCISLKNAHIEDLYKSITKSIKIEIVH